MKSHFCVVWAFKYLHNIKSCYFSLGKGGDYFRLLLPDTYTVTVSADGYYPKTATVTIGPDVATVVSY